MNVFVLDVDPCRSARMLCDKHLIKMQLESAQLLSSSWHLWSGGVHVDGLYKPTHVHHPCTQKLVSSWRYVLWVFCNAREMAYEHQRRYGSRLHRSYEVTKAAFAMHCTRSDAWHITNTEFPLAMTDSIRRERKAAPIETAVELYRQYYIEEKAQFATWTNAEIPEWFTLTNG